MAEPYDPQAPEEGSRRGSDLMSKKDWKAIALVIILLGLILWPVYLHLAGDAKKSICKKNMRKIGSALGEYTNDFDGRLPYTYERAGYGSSEVRLRNGLAYTWQWQLQRYTRDWSVFTCPAADPVEHSKTSDGASVHLSDFGMLNGFSGIDVATVSNPGRVYVIGETSNFGALDSYNPRPLKADGAILENDGFMIGFDNNEDYPNSATHAATRLAFRNVKNGQYASDSPSRHPGGIHMLTLDGGIRTIAGDSATIKQFGGDFGSWNVPPPPRLGR